MFNVVANIPQILLIWFQCTPSDALWDPLRQSQCDHRKSVYYTYFVGAVAALSDFYLAIIPIGMFMPLRIDRRLKWGLYFLMGCGVFAGVAAIVRTWAATFIMAEDSSCKKIPSQPTQAQVLRLDTKATFIDGVAILFLWGEVEEWIVLITMCIPPVWPLFRPLVQRFLETTTSRSRSRHQNYTPYNRTDQDGNSSRLWPPRVTTTISVSSVNGTTTTAVSPGKSSDSTINHDDQQEEEPHKAFYDRNMKETWVELPDLEERSILDVRRPAVPRH